MLKSQKKNLALNTKPQTARMPDKAAMKVSKPDKVQPKIAEKVSEQAAKSVRNSKQAKIVTLLHRPDGATIEEMAKATGWQRHSVHCMMSGVLKKRLGLSITSDGKERGRVYHINGGVSC